MNANAHANTPEVKKLRVRKCGARLRIPTEAGRAETVYTCNKDAHPDTEMHTETGVVHMGNQTLRRYVMAWQDAGVSVLRQHHTRGVSPRLKTRKLT